MPAAVDGLKQCTGCAETKSVEEFSKCSGTRDGLQYRCKTCGSAADREYREANPEKLRLLQLEALYGLSGEQVLELDARHRGLCAGCGQPESRTDRKHLSVDQNHETGKIRGLLCDRCNVVLGKVRDEPATLIRLAGYLAADGDSRPSWDQYWALMAQSYALRADCTRRRVGAIIVRENRLLAGGYNGAATGTPGCLTDGACPRGRMSTTEVLPGTSYDTGLGACIALHAEQNALLRASWTDQAGSTMYVTDAPCDGCWRMLTGTPLAAVVWPQGRMKIR